MSRQAKLSWPCQPSSDYPTAPKRQRFYTAECSRIDKELVPSIAAVSTEYRTSCVVYNKGDVGVQIGSIKSMSDADKYALNKIPMLHQFIMSSQSMWNMVSNDPFSAAGLENTHGWFTPSTLMGVFVFHVLFLPKCTSSSERILVEKPMNKYTKASDHLKEHSYKKAHFAALEDMESFKTVMEHTRLPVGDQLQSAVGKQIQQNHEKLLSILKTVVLCGRQNISFRGHRDDSGVGMPVRLRGPESFHYHYIT